MANNIEAPRQAKSAVMVETEQSALLAKNTKEVNRLPEKIIPVGAVEEFYKTQNDLKTQFARTPVVSGKEFWTPVVELGAGTLGWPVVAVAAPALEASRFLITNKNPAFLFAKMNSGREGFRNVWNNLKENFPDWRTAANLPKVFKGLADLVFNSFPRRMVNDFMLIRDSGAKRVAKLTPEKIEKMPVGRAKRELKEATAATIFLWSVDHAKSGEIKLTPKEAKGWDNLTMASSKMHELFTKIIGEAVGDKVKATRSLMKELKTEVRWKMFKKELAGILGASLGSIPPALGVAFIWNFIHDGVTEGLASIVDDIKTGVPVLAKSVGDWLGTVASSINNVIQTNIIPIFKSWTASFAH